MKKLRFALAMLSNAMLLGLIVLLYLDSRNPYMKFLTSDVSKIYILLTCVLGVITGCLYMARFRRRR